MRKIFLFIISITFIFVIYGSGNTVDAAVEPCIPSDPNSPCTKCTWDDAGSKCVETGSNCSNYDYDPDPTQCTSISDRLECLGFLGGQCKEPTNPNPNPTRGFKWAGSALKCQKTCEPINPAQGCYATNSECLDNRPDEAPARFKCVEGSGCVECAEGEEGCKTKSRCQESCDEDKEAVPTPNTPLSQPCVSPDPTYGCLKINTALGDVGTRAPAFVTWVLGFVLGISGGIVLIIIIITGYRLMTSQGDPEKVKNAREQLTAAIVGLLFIIFSLVILQLITQDILRIPGFGG